MNISHTSRDAFQSIDDRTEISVSVQNLLFRPIIQFIIYFGINWPKEPDINQGIKQHIRYKAFMSFMGLESRWFICEKSFICPRLSTIESGEHWIIWYLRRGLKNFIETHYQCNDWIIAQIIFFLQKNCLNKILEFSLYETHKSMIKLHFQTNQFLDHEY